MAAGHEVGLIVLLSGQMNPAGQICPTDMDALGQYLVAGHGMGTEEPVGQ